jgi:hypothetical protein
MPAGDSTGCERLEDAFAQEALQRLLGGTRYQRAEHAECRLVHPRLVGLVHQRQRREAAQPLVGRLRRLRLGRAHPQLQLARNCVIG